MRLTETLLELSTLSFLTCDISASLQNESTADLRHVVYLQRNLSEQKAENLGVLFRGAMLAAQTALRICYFKNVAADQ